MSQRNSHVDTPYTEYMREVISRLVGEGYDGFTQDILADEMNVNKTTSFRNRLAQLVANGELICWQYWTEKNGVGNAYAANVTPVRVGEAQSW